ncbi:MAG: hypothetical protein JOZ65_16945 [Chloroflexi bacterium]|nr:hypothetical protein [Chloroflexota bacterium]
MVREAVSAWPESLPVAILASGSLSLDIGRPLAPHGRIAGVADPAWVDEVLGALGPRPLAGGEAHGARRRLRRLGLGLTDRHECVWRAQAAEADSA